MINGVVTMEYRINIVKVIKIECSKSSKNQQIGQ